MNMQKSKPVSFSMMVDVTPSRDADFKGIQSRSLDTWVDDSSALSCFGCKEPFGYGILSPRISHCRMCGRAFCPYCCCRTSIIPKYIKVPAAPPKFRHEDRTKTPVKVCDVCYRSLKCIDELNSNNVGSNQQKQELDLFLLKNASNVFLQDKDLMKRQWAIYKLSRFREIQYNLPDHAFSDEEKQMLWINRAYFPRHSLWIVQFLKHIDYEHATDAQLEDVKTILELHMNNETTKKVACSDLMCTRRCKDQFSSGCAIELLNQKIRCNAIRKHALSVLDSCEVDELKCLVVYLFRQSIYSSLVRHWLIQKCAESEIIANEVYWEIQTWLNTGEKKDGEKTEKTNHGEKSNHGEDIVMEMLSEWKQITSLTMREKIESCNDLLSRLRIVKKHEIKEFEDAVANKSFFFPTNLFQGALEIDTSNIFIHDTATCPVTLPTKKEGISPKLYKPSDVRKEQYLMNIIRMMKVVLKRDEDLDLPIVDYDIRPTSSYDGFVEMVPSCISLSKLRETNKSILAWIIEQNEGSQESASTLRDRFIQSCAAYSVITYLLLVEDRHLDNMMLRSDGALFHIDYGFILGQDSKKILPKPRMRITEEMLTAMGGPNSVGYIRFRELSNRIFNCLRRNINIFVCMLRMYVDTYPRLKDNGTFREDLLMHEIKTRFAPGESYDEAQVQLYIHIESSTQPSMVLDAMDYFHSKVRPSILYSTAGMYSVGKKVVLGLWNVVGLEKEKEETSDDNN